MLVKRPVIEEDTRKYLKDGFDKSFHYVDGSDLKAVIDEILHDRDIFTFFALHFEPRQGLILGNTTYWDDIRSYNHYGLILDFKYIPRELKIFNFETGQGMLIPTPERTIEVSLGYCVREGTGLTPERFIGEVNRALKESKDYLIEFDDKFFCNGF